jgi:NAD(P)-dependent dehydrogenase (short-subunit alcohol dehydrogenase family)
LLYTSSQKFCAQVLVNSINAQTLGIAVAAEVDFAALCGASGDRAADEMEDESVNSVLDNTLRMFGRVDILVHADEGISKGGLADIDEAFFDTMIRRNVKEPLFLTKFVARYMEEGDCSPPTPPLIFLVQVNRNTYTYKINRRQGHILLLVHHAGHNGSAESSGVRKLQRCNRANYPGACQRPRRARNHSEYNRTR